MKRIYGNRKSLMVSEEDEDSAVKYRERRRRRMAMTRMATVTAGSSGSTIDETRKHVAKTTKIDNPATSSTTAAAIMNLISIMETPPPPVYGVMSVVGRKREMEDEVFVRTNLCRPEVNGFRPVHFFAVFDGHGGRHVSALCKENMHVIMEEELMRVKVNGDENGGGSELWRTAINRSFERMDEMALRLCLYGGLGTSSNICRCNPQLSFMGSTALVSILTKEFIFVANCGDSRAVLCRNGRPIPLSVDHKPDREEERARIEGCSGRIMFADGARVEGILGMSRAIGDRLLKQWVTSEPEISVTRRETGDECLILGSDGLWDVLSSELACKIVHECLGANENSSAEPQIEANEGACKIVHECLGENENSSAEPQIEANEGACKMVHKSLGENENSSAEPQIEANEGALGETLYPSRSDSAAALLVRLALGRRSTGNISVIVIGLRK